MIGDLKITGVYVNYYFVCKRKLWLFAKHIKMEEKSDLVAIGKLIDEHSYGREKKHITIDNTINIDFIDNKGTINEVKKSKSIEKADIYQLKYYLYYLYRRGVDQIKGVIDYPKLKEKVPIDLTDDDINEFPRIISKIEEILEQEKPPLVFNKSKLCKKCSYYELCFI